MESTGQSLDSVVERTGQSADPINAAGVGKSIVFAVATAILAAMLKAIELAITDRNEIQDNPGQLLSMQYELLLIAASVVVSAQKVAPLDKKGKPFRALVWVVCIGVTMIFLSVLSLIDMPIVTHEKLWFTMLLPNILALVAMARAVYATREVTA